MPSNKEGLKRIPIETKLLPLRHLQNFRCECHNKLNVTYRKLANHFSQCNWIFRQAETCSKSCEDWPEAIFLTDQEINHFLRNVYCCVISLNSQTRLISLVITWSCNFSCTAVKHLNARILNLRRAVVFCVVGYFTSFPIALVSFATWQCSVLLHLLSQAPNPP